MKVIVISDLHGRAVWKEIVSKENNADIYVFMGDYFDSKIIPAQQQKDNFKDIIAFKKANIDKVILLTGNHSFHYLRGNKKHYTGYQSLHAIDIQELLHSALDENLLQMCFVFENFLFSHAGVTKTWCKENNIDFNNIEQSINNLFKYQPNAFEFTTGDKMEQYGDEFCQTPIWVRPKSLLQDKVDGFIYIVGHTAQDSLITTGEVILTDTLGTSGEYLEINNGILTAKKM